MRGDDDVAAAGEPLDDVDDEALETVVAQLRRLRKHAPAPKPLPRLSSTRWRSDFRRPASAISLGDTPPFSAAHAMISSST